MTPPAELLAQTDYADLQRANEDLQRQNDMLTGRVQRLNALLVEKERDAEAMEGAIIHLQRDMTDLRAGKVDAAQLGY